MFCIDLSRKAAGRLAKFICALPLVYAARKAAAARCAGPCVEHARARLMDFSPRPTSGWCDPAPSPRDPAVDLSIIVPVYNEEPFVGECLRSVLSQQTASSFEIIAVDDGSADASPAIMDALAAEDSRLRVVHQKNQGFSGARNRGLDLARGGRSCSSTRTTCSRRASWSRS